MRIKYFSAVILVLLFSCTGKKKDQQAKEKPPVMVDIIIAGNDDLSNSIEVNGSVLSNEMIELHPEISGKLVYLNIPDGAKVAEGTVLARINDADLQAQLEQQKSQLELAIKTEKRLRDLLAVNGVNQADYDAALTQVTNFQAAIKVLNAQIDKTVVKASFAGELGLRMVSPGAYVTPQTLLGTLQQTDNIKIDFTVPESAVNLIAKGDVVSVQSNGANDIKLATITAIEPQINTASRNVKARAILNDASFKPGTFVKVYIHQKKQGVIVPTNAIIPDAMSNQVIVIKNKKAIFKNVETGIRNADYIELKSGVQIGDSVVVNGILFVRPNAVVKVKKIIKKA